MGREEKKSIFLYLPPFASDPPTWWQLHDISHGARHEREARDEGKRKKNFFFLFFSSPRLVLRAKYRVRPACLVKHLSADYFKNSR